MATAASSKTAPAAMPRAPRMARQALPPAAVILTVAVVLRLVYDPWYGNYDSRYSLLWARDALRGRTPDYGTPFAPTPHPLETALSTLGVALGDQAMTWLVLLSFGGLVWLVYLLGAQLFSPGAGIVAAVVVATRPLLVWGAILGYQDTIFALLIVAAVLLEARRARRGAAVLALLALAGLMRPEAWVLSGLYWLYLWPSRTPAARLRLVGLAVAGPVLWALSDLVISGDALHSLHGTAHLADALNRRRSVVKAPYWAAVYFTFALRQGLIGIPVGLAFAWRFRLRAAVLPVVAVVVMTAVFLAGPVFGLPLISRYVRTPAVILTAFAGLAVVGWRRLPPGRERTLWTWAGIAVAVLSLALAPWDAKALHTQRVRLQRSNVIYSDLRAAARAGAVRTAFARCGGIATSDNRPMPFLRWWLDGPPGSVRTVMQHRGALGRMLLAPRPTRRTRAYYGKGFPHVAPPPGWRTLYQNRTWRVSAAPDCRVRAAGPT